jgi:ABC-type thiamine transport system ATPase subunit
MTWAIAIITASVGVPVTQKRRSPSLRSRTGGEGQRMAGARLLLGRRDDPDVVGEACGRSAPAP